MVRKVKALTVLALITALYIGTAAAQLTAAESVVCTILAQVKMLLTYIAGAIAAVIITLQGIKWGASADDPGARKQAKEAIIHAMVGLIIVIIAVYLVGLVTFARMCSIPAT